MVVTWCFFYWQIFAKFQPEKYDFGLSIQKKISWEKWAKFAKFWIKKNSTSPKSYDNLQKVAKEYRRILFFFFFLVLPSYLVCSQIWLNYFLDDCHFGYITKILKRNHVDVCVQVALSNWTLHFVRYWRI